MPDGSAQFMLAVEGDRFTAYVNDQRVLTAHDGSLKTGLLNYTLLSGTNRDYGTLCEMTNVELWTLAAPSRRQAHLERPTACLLLVNLNP